MLLHPTGFLRQKSSNVACEPQLSAQRFVLNGKRCDHPSYSYSELEDGDRVGFASLLDSYQIPLSSLLQFLVWNQE